MIFCISFSHLVFKMATQHLTTIFYIKFEKMIFYVPLYQLNIFLLYITFSVDFWKCNLNDTVLIPSLSKKYSVYIYLLKFSNSPDGSEYICLKSGIECDYLFGLIINFIRTRNRVHFRFNSISSEIYVWININELKYI